MLGVSPRNRDGLLKEVYSHLVVVGGPIRKKVLSAVRNMV